MAALRKTKQKQAVYEALTALDHPTATQVYERVHEEHPTVSRGTVFRVLGNFAHGAACARQVPRVRAGVRRVPARFQRDRGGGAVGRVPHRRVRSGVLRRVRRMSGEKCVRKHQRRIKEGEKR